MTRRDRRRASETYTEVSSLTDSISVAVIGAGMAGRSHAHAYRTAQTVFGTDAPPTRLVAIADVNDDFADSHAERYGFERAETAGRRSSMPTTSTPSASWWPTTCTARSPRRCSRPASTCSAKSRWRRALKTRGPWPGRRESRSGRGLPVSRIVAPRHHRRRRTDRAAGWGRCSLSTAATGATTARPRWRNQLAVPRAGGSGALADIGSHLIDLPPSCSAARSPGSPARCCRP